MTIGQNRTALKKYKKNILPPFENEGWTTNTGFSPSDLFKEGYSISFTAPQYQGVNIYLPDSLAGNTFSLSAEYAEGVSPWMEIIYMPAGSSNPVYRGVNAKTTKIEGYVIPVGATSIRVKISSTASGTNLVAFKNLQLEVGDKCTPFGEMMEVNKDAYTGLAFDGRGVVNINNMTTFLSAERDFSLEVTFTPKTTSKKSLEELLFGWSGWHEGILYNSVDNQLRVQIHFKNISSGAIGRDIVQTPVPAGRRTTATMVYKSSNREISIFIDGILKQRVISSYADKSIYSFNTYSTGLTFGATYGLTYGFNGSVEGGKVWDRALSDSEISKQVEVKPVLNYDFTNQDTTSSTVLDLVKKNTGTINGAFYLQKASKRVTAKNLFNIKDFDAGKAVGGGTMWMYSIQGKPNTKYMVSTNMPYTAGKGYANLYAGGVSTDSNGVKDGSPRQVITGNGGGIPIYVRNQTTSSEASEAYDKLISGTYWIQIEEGTVATNYQDFKMVNRQTRATSYTKASFRDYPFNFVRQAPTILDNVLYGINVPRITKDGVLIEDATVNLFTGNTQKGSGYTVVSADGWNKTTNDSAGTGSTASMGLRHYVDLAKLTNGQTYSCSATVYNPHDYAVDVHQDWCDVMPTGSFDVWTIQPKETKRISTTALKSQYDATYRFYDIAVQGNGNSIWIKDVQVENKKFPTSYTLTDRKKENFAINNAGRFIDTQKGSIEMEFIPLTGDDAVQASETWGAHDLATYVAGSGGFILRRSYTKANRIELVVVSPVSGINLMGYADTVGWKNGDLIKYRLEWDMTANTTTVTINDSYVLRVASCFKMFDPSYIYSLTVGSRGLIIDGYGCGNAIYKNLVIRNRNGETVYKL